MLWMAHARPRHIATILVTVLIMLSGGRQISGQVEWILEEDSVFRQGDPGTWDAGYVYANSLLMVVDEYRLYYTGTPGLNWPSGATVGCASSRDLITWKRCGEEGSWCDQNPVLPPSIGSWNEVRGGAAVILRDDLEDPNPFKMWYVSVDATGEMGFSSSPDGCEWTGAINPVLRPSQDWEIASIAAPSVIFDPSVSRYRAWYSGNFQNGCSVVGIGLAESEDGVDWKKYDGNPVLTGDPAQPGGVWWPKVLFDADRGTYEMWYRVNCGADNNYATSLDGITWCKHSGNPLLGGGGPVLWDGERYQMLANGGTFCDLYSSPRTLPWAVFAVTLSPGDGSAPLTVNADASDSTSPAPPITSYSWDFGDDSPAGVGDAVTHVYQQPGEYLLKLTVTDAAGTEASVARKVSVSFAPPEPSFRRADADANGVVELTDAIFVLNNQFLGGPSPTCMDAADSDDNGAYDLTDAIFSLNFQFLGGPAPPAPGHAVCGPDPTDDALACRSYACR